MSFMTDVYFKPPANPAKEAVITDRMIFFGGRLDLREDTDDHDLDGVCLSYEFDDIEGATQAADLLRELGEDFEGPYEMRPDWTEGRAPAAFRSSRRPTLLSNRSCAASRRARCRTRFGRVGMPMSGGRRCGFYSSLGFSASV